MDFVTTLCHELLEHGGIGTFTLAILSLIMFHLGVLIVGSKLNMESLPKFLIWLRPAPTPKRELENSTFFQSMFLLKMGVIPRLDIRCKLRHKVFTRLLYIKVDMLEMTLREFIAKEEIWKDLEVDDLEIVLKSILAESDIKWQRESKDRGIPEVAINLFKSYNQPKTDILEEVIISSALSKHTGANNHERVLMFMDALSIRELKSLDSLDKTLATLNGHLSRVEFEGEKCTNCDPDCPHQTRPQ